MNTLGDAWERYRATRHSLERVRKIGRKYWNDQAEGARIRRDDVFENLTAQALEQDAAQALLPIDDLGVLVLFSVFEAAVRRHPGDEVALHAAGLTHPVVRQAVEDAVDTAPVPAGDPAGTGAAEHGSDAA